MFCFMPLRCPSLLSPISQETPKTCPLGTCLWYWVLPLNEHSFEMKIKNKNYKERDDGCVAGPHMHSIQRERERDRVPQCVNTGS